MTIKSAPYYWVECDGDDCGAKSTEGGDFAAWGDRQSAVDEATGQDWTEWDGKFYCPACSPKCPEGCGCRLGTGDADARECGCDGPCCTDGAAQ